MATSLLLACDLNEHQNSDKFVFISEDTGADGSFLVSSILGQRVRASNSGVILVCLQNTFEHYFNAGMRLGSNLQMFMKKNLRVIEPLQDLIRNFPNSKWFTNDKDKLMDKLLEEITNCLNELIRDQSLNRITVIIDNLEILLNFGVQEKDLISFCKYVQNISLSENEAMMVGIDGENQISLIVKLGNSEIFHYLNNNLENECDFHVNLLTLKSGQFKEVDGKIITRRVILNGAYEMRRIEKEILYKVNDRNIKIFNPGEIGVKI